MLKTASAIRQPLLGDPRFASGTASAAEAAAPSWMPTV